MLPPAIRTTSGRAQQAVRQKTHKTKQKQKQKQNRDMRTWGGVQRRLLTGGAAYGMPRNSATGPTKTPLTSPLYVSTTGRGIAPSATPSIANNTTIRIKSKYAAAHS
jgi:hypothetical protein